MRLLLAIALFPAFCALAADGPSARIVVQRSVVAGFVYYDGRAVWERMKAGDRLKLVREPSNPHDASAIRIEWEGHALGYLPRRDNADLSRQIDLGARPEGRITSLSRAANGRNRIAYEIFVPLKE
jgi:hypothetical protein